MSRESWFRKIIKEQDPQGKEEVWKKIEAKMAEQEPETEVDLGEVLAKKRGSVRNRIILIAAGFLLVAALVTIILLNVLPKNEEPVIKRYHELQDYRSVQVQTSIEDYAKANNYEMLYFDWYKDSEDVIDWNYKLNNTGEVVCVSEQIMDEYGNYLFIWINDIYTEIDIFDGYLEACDQILSINSTEIKWGINVADCYAMFRYKNWDYHVKLEYNTDSEYFISLLQDLIK